jgi:hypothetical protein
MKDAEDEAFDELARRQGSWGGGYQAKRKAATDKLQEPEREALKLALAALNRYQSNLVLMNNRQDTEAITAIKEALAQPAQEPVAWVDLLKEAQQIVKSKFLWKKFIDGTPLANDIAFWMADFAQQYTAPPKREWVGLTDDALADIWYKGSLDWMEFARAHEADLKEKNNGT